MSERKVLNKYYPPDFDPSKIPKMRMAKNRTFSIRIMAPFNMRCDTCGEYIYKGKKFNSRKENVDEEFYLGLRIFRFYIKCPRCVAEIAFKTDLENTDYALEAGATRLFEAEKRAQQMATEEQKAREADEMNPMKVLENRTKASRNEIEELDKLEELREINSKTAGLDHEQMILLHSKYEDMLLKLQGEEDEEVVQSIFGKKWDGLVKRLADSDSDDDYKIDPPVKKKAVEKATDNFEDNTAKKKEDVKKESWQKSIGSLSSKKLLSGLVKKKPVNLLNANLTFCQGKSAAVMTQSKQDQGINAENDQKQKASNLSIKGSNSSKVSASSQSQTKPAASSLSLLGNYSGTDSDDSTGFA